MRTYPWVMMTLPMWTVVVHVDANRLDYTQSTAETKWCGGLWMAGKNWWTRNVELAKREGWCGKKRPRGNASQWLPFGQSFEPPARANGFLASQRLGSISSCPPFHKPAQYLLVVFNLIKGERPSLGLTSLLMKENGVAWVVTLKVVR